MPRISKTETAILNALTSDFDWMKKQFTMITGATQYVCKGGFLSLCFDRASVRVYGKLAIRTAGRMIQEGKLQGYVDTDRYHPSAVITLSEEARSQARDCDTDADLVYELDNSDRYRWTTRGKSSRHALA